MMHSKRSIGARIMLIGRDRICYRGLLGNPSRRQLAALMIYVAPEGQVRLRTKGAGWVTGDIVCARPFEVHDVSSSSGSIITLLIEPESVDRKVLEDLANAVADREVGAMLAKRIRSNIDTISATTESVPFSSTLCDRLLLDRHLPERRLDRRIVSVLAQLRAGPNLAISAEMCARRIGLSTSRFLRLFKANVGTTYRAFRAWRRSREMLSHVNQPANLAFFAIDAGYPDSTYFCHSTRKIWGLQPSVIFAGSRRLTIRTEPALRWSIRILTNASPRMQLPLRAIRNRQHKH